MSISSSDTTNSYGDNDDYIMSCTIADHAKQVAREKKLLTRQQQHTSRSGIEWGFELLHGCHMRVYKSMPPSVY